MSDLRCGVSKWLLRLREAWRALRGEPTEYSLLSSQLAAARMEAEESGADGEYWYAEFLRLRAALDATLVAAIQGRGESPAERG
jgi:hypothetical protein